MIARLRLLAALGALVTAVVLVMQNAVTGDARRDQMSHYGPPACR